MMRAAQIGGIYARALVARKERAVMLQITLASIVRVPFPPRAGHITRRVMHLETMHQFMREHAGRRIFAQAVGCDVQACQSDATEGVSARPISAVPARDVKFVFWAGLGRGVLGWFAITHFFHEELPGLLGVAQRVVWHGRPPEGVCRHGSIPQKTEVLRLHREHCLTATKESPGRCRTTGCGTFGGITWLIDLPHQIPY